MKFVCFSALLVSMTLGSVAFGHGDIEAEKEITSSREAFRQLIKNPVIGDAFTYVQQELLPTKADSRIRNFFRDNPVLGQLYQAYVDTEEQNLDDFAKQAAATMMRIRKDMGSEQARELHRMVVDLAGVMGFSDEAIENVEIYLTGGENQAFTVSASKHRIIIVFQSDLLKTMTNSAIRDLVLKQLKLKLGVELQAIAGHELGHIVLAHSTVRRMNVFMLNLLKDIFVQSPEGQALVDQNMATNLQNHICSGCGLRQNFGPIMNLGEGQRAASYAESQAQAYLNRQQPELRNRLLVQYLNFAMATMDEFLAPEHTIQVIQSYQAALINTIETGNSYVPWRDAREFVGATTHLLLAFSRSQETSSDRISDSVVQRQYLASAFIRMLGIFPSDVNDRQKLIGQTVVQGNGLLNTSTRSDLSQLIGSTHPSNILRIFQMVQMPSYPAIVMAHPFVKLLALNQYLMMEKAMTKTYLSETTFDGEHGQAEKIKAEQHLEETAKASAEVMATILNLLKHRTVDQKKHPRLANLIQYSLIQREQQLAQIQDLRDQLANPQLNPQVKKSLEIRVKRLQTIFLPQATEFLNRVIAELNQAGPNDNEFKSARLGALKVASQSLDLAQVKSVRAQMLELDPKRNWTKDPTADISAPDFIVPREIKPPTEPAFIPRPATPSYLRRLHCEEIVRGV